MSDGAGIATDVLRDRESTLYGVLNREDCDCAACIGWWRCGRSGVWQGRTPRKPSCWTIRSRRGMAQDDAGGVQSLRPSIGPESVGTGTRFQGSGTRPKFGMWHRTWQASPRPRPNGARCGCYSCAGSPKRKSPSPARMITRYF